MTHLEIEEETQAIERAMAYVKLSDLRRARAWLLDAMHANEGYLAELCRVRGELVHAQIEMRESLTGLRGAIAWWVLPTSTSKWGWRRLTELPSQRALM